MSRGFSWAIIKPSSSCPSVSLCFQLTWDAFQARKCLPLLPTFSAPQLSQCCGAPPPTPFSFDPLLSRSIGLNCATHPPGFVLWRFLPGLTTVPASLALGVPPSASALRRGRRICPGTEARAPRGHEAAPLLHPASCPQERSVGILASLCSECLL